MKKILLVIDMQNGFARYDETKELQKKIRELLERKLFDAVVATRFLNDDNSTYQRLIGWNRLKTEEERELAEGYDKYVDHVVDKHQPQFYPEAVPVERRQVP